MGGCDFSIAEADIEAEDRPGGSARSKTRAATTRAANAGTSTHRRGLRHPVPAGMALAALPIN